MSLDHPIPKVLRQVRLPSEVVAALQEVQRWIEKGEEVTRVPTDDCIQIGCLCGGLMDDGSGHFYFAVFLAANYPPYKWDIALSPMEIADIASGKTAFRCGVAAIRNAVSRPILRTSPVTGVTVVRIGGGGGSDDQMVIWTSRAFPRSQTLSGNEHSRNSVSRS